MTFKEFLIELLHKSMIVTYILMMTIAALSLCGYVYSMICYVMWMLVFCEAFAYVFLTGQVENAGMMLKWVLIMGCNLIVMLLFSMVVWVFNLESLEYMNWASLLVRYQYVVVLGAVSAVFLFGQKVIDYTFYGMAAGNGILLLSVIQKYGLGTFISGLIEMFATKFEVDIPVMRALEMHDITFAIGLYLLYYLLKRKETRFAYLKIVVAVFFCVIGLKRISIIGVAAAMMVSPIFRLFNEKNKKRLLYVIAVVECLICYLWVYSIRSGLFYEVIEQMGVNTMGRSLVWSSLDEDYVLSPFFLGHGVGYVTSRLTELSKTGLFSGKLVLALHNDILAYYIELGWPGFILWLLCELVLKLHMFIKDFDTETGVLYSLFVLATWISYFTDNTYMYVGTNYALRLIVMAYAFRNKGGGIIQ